MIETFKVGDKVSITDLRDNVVLFSEATISKLEPDELNLSSGRMIASFAEPSICFRCSTKCLKKVGA